jgi:hypothetical protein
VALVGSPVSVGIAVGSARLHCGVDLSVPWRAYVTISRIGPRPGAGLISRRADVCWMASVRTMDFSENPHRGKEQLLICVVTIAVTLAYNRPLDWRGNRHARQAGLCPFALGSHCSVGHVSMRLVY